MAEDLEGHYLCMLKRVSLKYLILNLVMWCCLALHAQEDALVYFNNGSDLALNKDHRGAILAFDRALSLDPNLYYIYASRAESKTELGDFRGAILDYNMYKKLVEELNLLGDSDVLDKRQKLILLVPSLANVSASADPSAESFENTFEPINSSEDLKALYYRGKLKFESGELMAAINDFSLAINGDPDFAIAYTGRGYAYLKGRDLPAALRDFNAALRLNPSDYSAMVGRGEVKDKARNYDKAIEDFTAAITMAPGKYHAFYDRGLSWFNQKNYAKAEADFTTVLKLNSKHEKAYFNRAVARINQNLSTEACLDLKMAKSLGHQQAGIYLAKFCE